MPKILAFAGSLRRESYNKKLVPIAAASARQAGAEVTEIDLRDYPLPVFDEDLERAAQGMPEHGRRLKQLFVEHHGLLIAAPVQQLNHGRAQERDRLGIAPGTGRAAAGGLQRQGGGADERLTGALGGLRGLVHVRSILGNLGVLVLPEQLAVARAFEAFAEDGTLKDAKLHAGVQGLGKALAGLLLKVQA